MTKHEWARIIAFTIPAVICGAIVAATLGPLGALLYGALLTAGVNTRHLFRTKGDR